MITLTTLGMASKQEVFNQVCTHLLTQAAKSGDYDECKYRDGELKCAAGCLIGDDEYRKEWETWNWDHLVSLHKLPGAHKSLISRLQYIHDNRELIDWPPMLESVGKDEGLNVSIIDGPLLSDFYKRISV